MYPNPITPPPARRLHHTTTTEVTLVSSGNPQPGQFVYAVDHNLAIVHGKLESSGANGFSIMEIGGFLRCYDNCFTTIKDADAFRLQSASRILQTDIEHLETVLSNKQNELKTIKAMMEGDAV